MINPGFATDRRINLRKQGGWYLYQSYTALVGCSSKTCHVTHNTTAKSDHTTVACKTGLQQTVEHLIEHIEILVLLTVW